jgi:two-component system response regulator VanR
MHAVDGVEGTNLFDKGTFDLIITDIEMPNMNGWEFIRYIQSKSYPNDKIIIISAQSEQMLSIGV